MFRLFSSLSLGLKFSVISIVSLLTVLSLSTGIVSRNIWNDFYTASQREAMQYVQQVYSTVSAYDESAREQARKDYSLFRARTQGEFALQSGGTQSDTLSANLLLNGSVLNGDYGIVDEYTSESGGAIATIFVRQGEDFFRITTSLKNDKGQRAVGTKLDKAHPAYAVVASGKMYVGRANLFGKEFMTIYDPIVKDGAVIGILFIGSEIGALLIKLSEQMHDMQFGQTGGVYAVNVRDGVNKGRIFGEKDASLRVNLADENSKSWLNAISTSADDELLNLAWSPVMGASQEDSGYMVAVRKFDAWGWVVIAEAPVDELMSRAYSALAWVWGGILIAVAVLAGVIIFSARRLIGNPIGELGGYISIFSAGDLSKPVATKRSDEIGRLCEQIEMLRKQLHSLLATVRSGADSVAGASVEIASGNSDLSSRTENQASALEQTAASMEELRATVQKNSENAAYANTLAAEASGTASDGGRAVSELVVKIRKIQSQSNDIAEIVGVIDSIAFQTNILALNAAVEAARAGEQGRGFAVVASEVRALATRSSESAKQIRELIAQSVTEVTNGVTLADKAGSTMVDVVQSISKVSQLVGEISSASQEQSEGVSQVVEAMHQLDQGTQQNAAMVEEMAAAAAGLNSEASRLVESVRLFKL